MNLSKYGGLISTLMNFSGICNVNGINLSNSGNKSKIGTWNKIDLIGVDVSKKSEISNFKIDWTFDARNRNLNNIDLTNDNASKKSSKITNLSRIGNINQS